MQGGVLLEKDDIKEIIANHFNVPVENVVPTKYNYMVVGVTENDVKNSQ